MISLAWKALLPVVALASLLVVDTPPKYLSIAAPATGLAPLELDASFAVLNVPIYLDCNATCELICEGDPGSHKAPPASGAEAWVRNPHTYCVGLQACSGHPECERISKANPNLDFDRLENLIRLVADGSDAAATQLQSEFSGIVAYNSDRHALQVYGCEPGVVTAHLPLNAVQVRAVRVALD